MVGLDRDPILVKGGGEAIVDGGATETFLTEQMAKDLGIRELVGDRRVQVKGVGAKMESARGGNSVELLMRCRCPTCGDKWIPRIHHSVYVWEGEGMTENLISPHGFGDMRHVTGPGESWSLPSLVLVRVFRGEPAPWSGRDVSTSPSPPWSPYG